jgi:hypothetical protein
LEKYSDQTNFGIKLVGKFHINVKLSKNTSTRQVEEENHLTKESIVLLIDDSDLPTNSFTSQKDNCDTVLKWVTVDE